MRKNEILQTIDSLFIDSCRAMFESLGCTTKLTTGIDPLELSGSPIACIDAGSEDIEILIALQLPLEVLALTYPAKDGLISIEERSLEDWISEIANQLIGRIKARLLEHDCAVNIGLPVTYFDIDINELLSDQKSLVHYYFDVDNQICGFSISIELFNDGLSFSIEANNDVNLQEGGELELF